MNKLSLCIMTGVTKANEKKANKYLWETTVGRQPQGGCG